MLKINSIVKHKRKDCCFVNFTDEKSVLLSLDIIVKYALKPGLEIDEDRWKQILDEQSIIDVKQAAYNFASYKPRTEFQIKQALKKKGFNEDAIKFGMEFLKEFNLFDDNKYARNFIFEILNKKPCGRKVVFYELLKKGISKDIASSAIEDCFPEDDKTDMALKAAEKKLKLIQNKPMEKQKQSLINFLKSRGFDWDTIKNVINHYYDE